MDTHATLHHDAHAHHEHHEHEHEHEEPGFWTKYVFSQDHKMISKQFLVTAVFMGVLAMIMSICFRLQLAWPEHPFPFLNAVLGDKRSIPLKRGLFQ